VSYSNIIDLKSNRELLLFMKRAMPHYRKHKVIVVNTDSVEPHGTSWDGGSRSSYAIYSKNGDYKGMVPAPTAPPQFGGGYAKPYTLAADEIVISAGIFRGKTATATLYIPKTEG
jgi:hypothetical protein